MTHWKALMDPKDCLFAFDLQGREIVVQIERVSAGEIVGEKGRKSKKPKCTFVGKKKPLLLNATNCKTLAKIAGTDHYEKWAGLWITLFPTTTQDKDGATVECIRIRPRAAQPPTRGGQQQQQQEPDEREPGADEGEVQP